MAEKGGRERESIAILGIGKLLSLFIGFLLLCVIPLWLSGSNDCSTCVGRVGEKNS